MKRAYADANVSSGMLVCESLRKNNQDLYLSRTEEVVVPKNPPALAVRSFRINQATQVRALPGESIMFFEKINKQKTMAKHTSVIKRNIMRPRMTP